jgi:DUF1680 family protein
MPVERIYAHPAVAANTGRVALRRGPIVYCIEQADNPVPLDSLVLPRAAPLRASYDAECLGGVVHVHAEAHVADAADWGDQLYRSARPPCLRPHELIAVPYAVWDNRSAGQMQVWIRDVPSA